MPHSHFVLNQSNSKGVFRTARLPCYDSIQYNTIVGFFFWVICVHMVTVPSGPNLQTNAMHKPASYIIGQKSHPEGEEGYPGKTKTME